MADAPHHATLAKLALLASPAEAPSGASDARTTQRGRGRPALWFCIGAVAGALVLTVAGRWSLMGHATTTRRPASLERMAISPSSGTSYAATGNLIANRRAVLSSNIVGRVTEVLVQPGDKVAKGQLIARLDDRAAVSQLAGARASLARAQAEVLAARARLALAEAKLARYEVLAARAFVSPQQLEEFRSAAETSRQDLSVAQSEADLMSTTVHANLVNVDDHQIRAPFSGIISNVTAQPGEIVSPSSAGGDFIRTGIAALIDPLSFHVEADLPEKYIRQITVGTTAIVNTKGEHPAKAQGRVSWISPTANQQRGTVTVGVNIPPMAGEARDGLEVEVEFVTKGSL